MSAPGDVFAMAGSHTFEASDLVCVSISKDDVHLNLHMSGIIAGVNAVGFRSDGLLEVFCAVFGVCLSSVAPVECCSPLRQDSLYIFVAFNGGGRLTCL
ncbi:hypothetical protein HGG76_11855 [Ochrobactrum tritici]|uniref:Uncharacterized protein n=1 Tax=Brucella tritici TaxID=94626 RepID=A0A7X6FQB1_9HYPH|nr:hypothetical protein [Brucella tritici]